MKGGGRYLQRTGSRSSGLGFQVKALQTLSGVPSLLGSGHGWVLPRNVRHPQPIRCGFHEVGADTSKGLEVKVGGGEEGERQMSKEGAADVKITRTLRNVTPTLSRC